MLRGSGSRTIAKVLGLFFESRRQLHVKHEAARVLPGFEDLATDWEQDYFRGKTAEGEPAPEHQTRLNLKPFGDPPPNRASPC